MGSLQSEARDAPHRMFQRIRQHSVSAVRDAPRYLLENILAQIFLQMVSLCFQAITLSKFSNIAPAPIPFLSHFTACN